MATIYQCQNCGREFQSSGSPYCWECGSAAQNATEAGALMLAGTFLWGWISLVILIFAIAGFLLLASIVPIAFGTTSIYLTAVLTRSSFPEVPAAVLPVLTVVFVWTLLRMLIFVRGRGRKAMVFITGYFLLALVAGLVLTYTEARPFGLDMPYAATNAAVAIGEMTATMADDLQGGYQSFAPALRGISQLVSNLDTRLFSVSVVVFCCILLMETALFLRLMRRFKRR